MAQRGRILIVDDEANARAALSEILREEGYATETAADGFKALGKIDDFGPDVVLTDLKMPGLDGIAFMEKARSAAPSAVFVVMTAFGTISSAVEAMKKGAENYLLKPLDPEALGAVVERSMEKARLVQETKRLRERLRERNAVSHIVSGDPKMYAVLELVAQVGPSKASVLITGESGTGKELIAEAIHTAGPRAKAPFVRLHCAALSETLLESELFGHERGAFTGAVAAKPGLLETAAGGTLFLDEVGELPLATQAKLLRVIETREVTRLGSVRPRRIDVRFIAATNRELEAEVGRGAFRQDLYFRFNGITLTIPPLRARVEEIRYLAELFARQICRDLGRAPPVLPPPIIALLESYAWPGNIRELKNVVERAVLLSSSPIIGPEHLPLDKLSPGVALGSTPSPRVDTQKITAPTERDKIIAALNACAGNQSRAAEML